MHLPAVATAVLLVPLAAQTPDPRPEATLPPAADAAEPQETVVIERAAHAFRDRTLAEGRVRRQQLRPELPRRRRSARLAIGGIYGPASFSWTVPNNPVDVGIDLSAQGFALGSECLNLFNMSNIVDFRVK